MSELCHVSLAEIENDRYPTDTEDNEMYSRNIMLWKETLDKLLAGETIETGCAKFSLRERLIDEYENFADFVDSGFDFMGAFKAGKLSPVLNELIRNEASVLASIIIG